jgi:hypothetical protein
LIEGDDDMIRAIATRRIDCKQSASRSRKVSPTFSITCDTIDEAVAEFRLMAQGTAEMAPGYMPMTEIKFYSLGEFQADPLKAVPLLTLTGSALAGVINVPGQTA